MLAFVVGQLSRLLYTQKTATEHIPGSSAQSTLNKSFRVSLQLFFYESDKTGLMKSDHL